VYRAEKVKGCEKVVPGTAARAATARSRTKKTPWAAASARASSTQLTVS
jgi:hypothetical protein